MGQVWLLRNILKVVSSNPITPNFCHIPHKIDKKCILGVKFQQGYIQEPLKMDICGSSMTAKEHIKGGFIKFLSCQISAIYITRLIRSVY